MVDDDASDASLMRKVAGGDPAAFDVLVGRWRNRVFRLALRFFRRPEDAEDVAQEVFLKLYRTAATYRSEAPLEHFLLRIATNACVDRLRESARRREQVLSHERMEHFVVRRLTHRLDLDETQRKAVEEVVHATRLRLEEVHAEVAPRIDAILDDAYQKILPSLTPEQQKKLEEIRAETRERLHRRHALEEPK